MGDADGAGIPDVAVNNLMMRDDWIKRQMAKRISEFTEEKTLHIFLGTWNVNAKKENCRLEAWLRPPQMAVSPDIYAIGMQEIVDLNASNVMRDPQTAEPWIQKFQSCLSDNYLLVNYKQLVGIVLCVFAKKDIYPAHMSQVLMAQTGVGVMGIGNKGAIAISFNLYDSSICVVNSHLAAHQNNAQARNDNFRDINEKLRFSPGAERGQRAELFPIDRHDYVFWIGDLNYRIDLPDMDVIYERIAANDLSYLLRYDQLMVERANEAVFQRYSEGSVTFPPTYKFQPNTNEYERRPDKKKRAPAWCDRILWKTQSGNAQQLFYQSAPSLLMSDHKPVMSCFAIAVKVLVQERRNEVFQSLVKQLDALENQQIPKIALSSTSVHFPAVHFDQRQSQTIQLRNDGEAIVQFHFAPKPDAATKRDICKPWLSIEPAFGIIPPGETLDITIQIHVVSRDIAFGLNTRQLVLDDILIMKLFKGCDYFIPVSGDWLPSCAASTIEYLVCVSGPVRTQASVQPSAGDNVLAIPKELWRIVDYLYRNGGLSTPELFTSCGNNDDVPSIFDDLDANTAFRKQYAPISMAEVLVRFLDSLSKPVIPIQLCQEFRQSPDPTAFCKQCLIDLPLAHYNVVIYIVSFLRELLTRQEQNEIQPRDLALVFGQALTQFPPRSSSSTDSPGADLMMHLLTSPAFE